MSAVDVRGAWKRFGAVAAVRDVSFTAESGSFLSLLGPSGCGKTTTLRRIAGFEKLDSAEIRIGARRIDAVPPWQRNLGVVFQHYALFPFLNVAKNVAFGLERRRVGKRESRQRVGQALELVGLPQLESRYPCQLSGGQQQRVALARALVIDPHVLLLDEPLSNLDAKLRAEMRLELKRIQRESGVTTIFVNHDQEEALTMSDSIAVMNQGGVVGHGTPKTIWQNPRTEFVADFLGVENLFPATYVDRQRVRLRSAAHGGDTGVVVELASAASDPAREIVLGIRSVDVVLGEHPPADAVNVFQGTIKETNYRGTFFTYQVETAFASPHVIASSQVELTPGQPVYLQLPPPRLMLLERTADAPDGTAEDQP